jgi:hypothetical protein
MTYTYAVHVTESDGSRRSFEYSQGERLTIGEAVEDHERNATYIVASITESASRTVGEIEAVFSFTGTWPEVPFELHSLSLNGTPS